MFNGCSATAYFANFMKAARGAFKSKSYASKEGNALEVEGLDFEDE
jgi:hypothetical protein